MTQKQEISNGVKLLMITRKVDKDDHLAGFTYDWVKKIGENVSELKVICLQRGNIVGLPNNIKIESLDDKGSVSMPRFIRQVKRIIKFHKLAKKFIKEVDVVFTHMNPEYAILIAFYAKLNRKPLIHWYTHKKVSLKLWLVNLLADKIVTAIFETCPIKSNKVVATGHGIDINKFITKELRSKNYFIKLLSIGRISPSKNYETMIGAVENLNKKKINVYFQIIGEAGLKSQQNYLTELEQNVTSRGLDEQIKFLGAVPNIETVEYYQDADIFINAANNTGVDKTVLEAMACGCFPLVSGDVYDNILPELFRFKQNNVIDLNNKIVQLINIPEQEKNEWRVKLRKIIENNHNLDNLVKKILAIFKQLQ